jgi:hypothetical protein
LLVRYSGDSFIFHYFSSESANDRAELRAVIGTEAERLTHLFGTMDRSVVNRSLFELRPNETLSPLPITIRARGASGPGVGTMVIPPQDQAAIMLITVADYLDQMVSVNGWKHVHQEEGTAMAPLYPGSGKPEIAFFWFSRVCRGLVPFLEIVPPIFNHCTEELTHADETRARDLCTLLDPPKNQSHLYDLAFTFHSHASDLSSWSLSSMLTHSSLACTFNGLSFLNLHTSNCQIVLLVATSLFQTGR